METKIFFRMDVLVLTILTVSLSCVCGNNNTAVSTTSSSTLVEDKRTPLEEGATPIFDMTHGFLKLLHGDKFYDKSEAISEYHHSQKLPLKLLCFCMAGDCPNSPRNNCCFHVHRYTGRLESK